MKKAALFLFFCFGLAGFGCSKDTIIPIIPPTASVDSLSYEFDALGFQSMRPGEFMVLWVKIAPDPSWQFVSVLTLRYRYADDSVVIAGKLFFDKPLDSLKDVLLTLERTPTPEVPGLLLAHGGAFVADTARKQFSTSLDARSVLGDYSNLQGGIVFTSPLSDTLSYNHEFYLMNQQGTTQTPSLISLNNLPEGWKYGLWAVDTDFTPHQSFFYGLFSSAEGHDSDSTNDHYPYPGGWKPQLMNVQGGSIKVTLEPEFYGDSIRFKEASPFTLLEFNRRKNIVENTNYQMKNVSVSTIPSGILIFTKH